VASDVDPRFDPAFQRGFEPIPRARVDPGPTPDAPPRVEPVETSPVTAPPVAAADSSQTRNPWLTVLWITAAVFTGLAVVAQYIAIEITYSPTPPTAAQEYVIPTVFGALAPTLFAAGLATAIAALVIHALRWQPRD
jgi:hypothetical protein